MMELHKPEDVLAEMERIRNEYMEAQARLTQILFSGKGIKEKMGLLNSEVHGKTKELKAQKKELIKRGIVLFNAADKPMKEKIAEAATEVDEQAKQLRSAVQSAFINH